MLSLLRKIVKIISPPVQYWVVSKVSDWAGGQAVTPTPSSNTPTDPVNRIEANSFSAYIGAPGQKDPWFFSWKQTRLTAFLRNEQEGNVNENK